MRLISCVLAATLMATPVAAQEAVRSAPPPQKLVISDDAIARGLATAPPLMLQPGTRDSLKNGAIIGAIVGAAALGGFGAWICHVLHEPSDPPCLPGVLRIAATGAGIGALGGAGIDALLTRNAPRPIFRIRF